MTERGRSDVTTDIDTEADRRDCPQFVRSYLTGHGEGRETNGQTGGESNVYASSSLAVDDARGNDLNIFRVVCRPRVLRTGGIARVGPRVLFALSCNTTPNHPKGWFTSEDGVTQNNPGYCKMG